MNTMKKNPETIICDIILSMERPFKVSQLLQRMEENGINDKDMVLEVLDQLCDSGLIKYSEVDNDEWAYRNNIQFS